MAFRGLKHLLLLRFHWMAMEGRSYMWQLLRRSIRRLDLWRFRHEIKDALALHRRGEVRSDGLTLENVRNHLEIRWRARDIHPWDRDRDLSSYERETAFAQQL